MLVAAGQLRQTDRSLELIVPAEAAATRRVLGLTGVLPVVPLHDTAAALAAVASAERVRAHRRKLDLRTLSARIEELSIKSKAGRGPASPSLARARPFCVRGSRRRT